MNKIYLIPLISGMIGYLTNYIAIKMLFHPRTKTLGFQGLIPKRKAKLAKNIGLISTEFMPKSFDNIKKIPIIGDKVINYLKKGVEEKVNDLNDEKLESIIFNVASSEFQFIEFIGFVLGFAIGLVQIMLI